MEYFYAEVDTWHVTHPSGEEVYFFPNGQTEAHFADSSKDILFPDGAGSGGCGAVLAACARD